MRLALLRASIRGLFMFVDTEALGMCGPGQPIRSRVTCLALQRPLLLAKLVLCLQGVAPGPLVPSLC